jgi:hypothetical protein
MEVLESLSHLLHSLGSHDLLCASLDVGLSASLRSDLFTCLRPHMAPLFHAPPRSSTPSPPPSPTSSTLRRTLKGEAAFLSSLPRWRDVSKGLSSKRAWSGWALRFRSDDLLARAASPSDVLHYTYAKQANGSTHAHAHGHAHAHKPAPEQSTSGGNGRVMKEVQRLAKADSMAKGTEEMGFDGYVRVDTDNARCLKVMHGGPVFSDRYVMLRHAASMPSARACH